MEIMIPVWEQSGSELPNAKSGVSDLRGARVALIDDNFDEPFSSRLEELLRKDYGVVVDRLIKPLGSAASPSELIERAAKNQAAIVGIAL